MEYHTFVLDSSNDGRVLVILEEKPTTDSKVPGARGDSKVPGARGWTSFHISFLWHRRGVDDNNFSQVSMYLAQVADWGASHYDDRSNHMRTMQSTTSKKVSNLL